MVAVVFLQSLGSLQVFQKCRSRRNFERLSYWEATSLYVAFSTDSKLTFIRRLVLSFCAFISPMLLCTFTAPIMLQARLYIALLKGKLRKGRTYRVRYETKDFNTTLIIYNIRESNEGRCQCIGSSVAGSTAKAFNISVAGL